MTVHATTTKGVALLGTIVVMRAEAKMTRSFGLS